MTREEAIQWLKVINTKEFGWDEFALQESQREIRERCEQGVREAIDMAIEALSANPNCKECKRHNNTTFFMDYEGEPSVSAEQKERGDADIPKNQSIMQQSRHDDGKMTREEAIHELQEDKRLYETEVCHAGDGSPDGRLLEALDMAIEALQDRPKGEWIESEMDKDFRVCSVCKNKGYKDKMAWRTEFIKSYLNFCPNCGAKMKGGNE